MSSDSYERVVKLWVSLWNLVLEDKRHLETVCATLQKLVFEKQGWPRYKNWPAICELGQEDRMLMLAAATLDMSRTDFLARNIMAAFPECFSEKETRGPVPWSVMRETAMKNASKDGGSPSAGIEYMESFHVHRDLGLPAFGFGTTDQALQAYPELLQMLPSTIDPLAAVGKIVTWHDKQFVVIENNDECDEIWIVPAECVALDL